MNKQASEGLELSAWQQFQATVAIVLRDLLAQLRSRSFLIQTVVLPMLLTLIIGNALGNTRERNIVPVALVAPKIAFAATLEGILNRANIARVTRMESKEAEALALAGKIAAVIKLPSDLERRLIRNQNVTVELVTDPANQETAGVLEGLTRAFLLEIEAGQNAVLSLVRTLRPEDATQLSALVAEIAPRVERRLMATNIKFENISLGGRNARFLEYYTVAFGVMFTLLSVTSGASGLLDETQRGTLARLRSAPISATVIVVAKILGLFAVALAQLGIYAVLTWLLFRVSWGHPLVAVAGITICAFAASGLGGVVLSIARTHEQLNTISLLIVLVMSLLGGSIWPIDTMPEATQAISRLTFNRWAIESIQLIASPSGGLVKDSVLGWAVLLGMGLLGLLAGTAHLSRKLRAV